MTIENQLDFYSDEIDLLKCLVDEINRKFTSTTNHLTHDLMSEKELKEEIREVNQTLRKKGKKLGMTLLTAYMPG